MFPLVYWSSVASGTVLLLVEDTVDSSPEFVIPSAMSPRMTASAIDSVSIHQRVARTEDSALVIVPLFPRWYTSCATVVVPRVAVHTPCTRAAKTRAPFKERLAVQPQALMPPCAVMKCRTQKHTSATQTGLIMLLSQNGYG